MKSKIRIISLVLFVIIFGGGVLYQMDLFSANGEDKKEQASAPAKEEETAVFVKAYVAKPEKLINQITSRGTVLPEDEVTVTSEVAGLITAIHFKEGDRVSSGQLLISLDDDELQAQLASAQHELAFFLKKKERDEKLKARGGVSEEAYEMNIRDLDTKKAEIELLKARIEKTQIRAPFAGKMGLRLVSKGAYLSPGTPISRLVNDQRVKVDFSIPEKYMAVVKEGNKVRFSVQGMPGEYEGTVYAIEPYIDAQTRTLQLRAISNNPGGKLIPGAFAEVELTLEEINNTIVIPTEAIIPEMTRKKVFIMNKGVAEEKEVKTGLRTALKVQVVEGLSIGDTVITSGIMRLRIGTEVEAQEVE